MAIGLYIELSRLKKLSTGIKETKAKITTTLKMNLTPNELVSSSFTIVNDFSDVKVGNRSNCSYQIRYLWKERKCINLYIGSQKSKRISQPGSTFAPFSFKQC